MSSLAWQVFQGVATAKPAPVVASSSVAYGVQGTLTPARPSGAAAGEQLLAIHYCDNALSGQFGAPSGWTQLAVDINTSNHQVIVAWLADGAVSSLAFTQQSNSDGVVIVLRITGGDTTVTPTAAAADGGTSGSQPTSYTVPSVSFPANANSLLVCAAGIEYNNTTATTSPPGDMTGVAYQESNGYTSLAVATKTVSLGASNGAETFTSNAASSSIQMWSGMTVAVPAPTQ